MSKGWKTSTIEEVCNIRYGTRIVRKRDQGTRYPVYGGGGETFRVDEFNREDCTIVSRFGMSKSCVRHVKGKFFLNDSGLSVDTICSNIIDQEFLNFFIYASMRDIFSLGRGSAQKNLDVKSFRCMEIRYPIRLGEQRKVVSILDEAFEGIDTAVANTEKNLANAREMFESLLGNEFSPEALEGKQVSLENVLSEQPRNGWSPPAKNHADAGTRVLTLSAVTGFHFRPEKFKFTSAAADPKRHYWVRNGDLLITRSNTPELVGHVAIAEALEEPTIYPDLIMRMTPDPARAITRYIYYQLRSPALRHEIKSRAHGANPTMKKVSKKGVQTLPIFLPGLEAQHAAVTKLDEIQAALQSFEGIALRKLAALAELKQSLLQKAFSGELTAGLAEVGLVCHDEVSA